MSVAEFHHGATARIFPASVRITRSGVSLWSDPEDQLNNLLEQLEENPITSSPVTSLKVMSKGKHGEMKN